MSKPAKAQPRTAKLKPGTDKPVDDQPHLSQREKFIQAAREAGCDETGEALDEALRKIGRAGTGKRPSS